MKLSKLENIGGSITLAKFAKLFYTSFLDLEFHILPHIKQVRFNFYVPAEI